MRNVDRARLRGQCLKASILQTIIRYTTLNSVADIC